jgi:hypothetical protein
VNGSKFFKWKCADLRALRKATLGESYVLLSKLSMGKVPNVEFTYDLGAVPTGDRWRCGKTVYGQAVESEKKGVGSLRIGSNETPRERGLTP